MKKIIAKYRGVCAETGKPINKGQQMYYDYAARKCYHLDSQKAKTWEDNAEGRAVSSYIQAQEDAYFDNQTGGYYSR